MIEKRDLLYELTHTIAEVKKFHDLLFQAREPGKPMMYFSPSLKLKALEPGVQISEGKRRWMFQLKWRQ